MAPKVVILKGAIAQRCGDPSRAAGQIAVVRPAAASAARRAQPPIQHRSSPNACARKIEDQREKIERLEGEKDEFRILLSNAIAVNTAEDMYWRKRFRSMKAQHNRWVADLKKTNAMISDAQDTDLLSLLAEAADWDTAAKAEEQQEREEATAAAAAVLESRKALEDAKQRNDAATKALADAMAREAASVVREEAANARAAVASAREAEIARKEKDLLIKTAELATADADNAAKVAKNAAKAAENAAKAAENAAKAKTVKRLQVAQARASQKPPTKTAAMPGSHAHSQWRRNQVEKVKKFLIGLFGEAWSEKFRKDRSTDDSSYCNSLVGSKDTKPDDVLEVLDMFFKDFQPLFDAIGDPKRRGKNLVANAEKVTVDAIQTQFDNVAVALHTATDITDRGYQALINYTSYVWNDDRLERLVLPWGNAMPRWMSKNALKERQKQASNELGIEITPNSAWLDPELVLIKRIRELIEKGFLVLTPDMTIKAQVLGDATTVWGSMGVNGTTIVIKAMYDDKN